MLARIDPRDYQTALDSAKADLQSAQATAANIDAQIREQQSTIAQAQATGRCRPGVGHLASEQEFEALRRPRPEPAYRQRTASVSSSPGRISSAAIAPRSYRDRAGLSAAKAHTDVLQTQRRQADATIAAKTAALAQANINLDQTAITAPVDGVVGDRTRAALQGQLVQAGTRLMTRRADPEDLSRGQLQEETQTGRMVPGQKVAIDIDSYPGQTINGTVDSLAPGTGAQFALLPPENATGNFTKIVQRVPVKIALDPANPLTARLRPGLSVTATVDTRSAPQPQQPAVNQAAR